MSPVWESPRAPALSSPVRRIVSLVPSVTESLFALGLGERVVGVTDWCVHPKDALESLPRVGGTKDADPDAIAALAPELVLANREENTRRVVEELDARGLSVWVSYPRTVREGAELLDALADLGAESEAREAVARPVLEAVAEAEAKLAAPGRDASRPRVFCPIWRDPWMAPSADTYIHDMIELCGGVNVTGEPLPANPRRDRREQRGATERYPQITLDELETLAPDVIWLPDEPYAFEESDRSELGGLDLPAARAGRIHRIDGTWVSWYGPRIRPALLELARLLRGP